jgi:hypothetical protein
MTCINLESDLGPIATLKSAQLAVAGTQGDVQVRKVEGKSIYDINKKDLRDYIDKNITEECINELIKQVSSVKDKDTAVII